MAFDTLKSETQEEEFNRVGEKFHDENIPQNSAGLDPIADCITDTCATLISQVREFVELHNSLKDNDPSLDTSCDASYNFHKVAYMLYQCSDELQRTIDTSWYPHSITPGDSVTVESTGDIDNQPEENIDN